MFIYRPLAAPVTVEISIVGGGTPCARHVSDRYNARLDWTVAREGRCES
jgi:hypothetical protein